MSQQKNEPACGQAAAKLKRQILVTTIAQLAPPKRGTHNKNIAASVTLVQNSKASIIE